MTQNADLVALMLTARAEREGGSMFAGKPDRWWDDPHWRCPYNHVSTTFLKSEALGNVCLACRGPIWLTFPEDRDGPLEDSPKT